MQVLNATQAAGIFKRSDVQIQVPTQKIGITVTGANDLKIRIRYISPGQGTKVIQDTISVSALLESDSFEEGFFLKTATSVSGTFGLSKYGSLDLKEGYLSVDIDSEAVGGITAVIMNAIETPVLTDKFSFYNPIYMNGGITREISLVNADYILLPIALVKTVDIEFAGRTVTYDNAELTFLSMDINALVSAPAQAVLGTALVANATLNLGAATFIRIAVDAAHRMSVTPMNATPFYVYAIEERSL